MANVIPEISLMQLKETELSSNSSSFVIEPLLPGFGLTLGNALRRVLLSSLSGVAITSIRIDGVNHEFSSIKGVVQDVVDIILNLKQVRFKAETNEQFTIILDVKGPHKVTANDFKCPTGIKVINKELPIAELVTGGKFLLEATVEYGRGYLPTESRKEEKLPIGVIAIDAAFSPITKVNFQVENTRVGKMTNFDRLLLEIETDGSVTPRESLEATSAILVEHFSVLSGGQSSVSVDQLDSSTHEIAQDEIIEEKPLKKPVKNSDKPLIKSKKADKA